MEFKELILSIILEKVIWVKIYILVSEFLLSKDVV